LSGIRRTSVTGIHLVCALVSGTSYSKNRVNMSVLVYLLLERLGAAIYFTFWSRL